MGLGGKMKSEATPLGKRPVSALMKPKAIRKRFAQYFPQLASVYLRTTPPSLGSSGGERAGLECLRTVAYLIGHRLTDQAMVPVQGEVRCWDDIRRLLVRHDCLVAGSIVVIERVVYDHVKHTQSSIFYLRAV
jgi:hypothetical protein